MATLADYTTQVQNLVHDTNFSDFSQTTLTNFINQARVRVALDTHCVRGFLSLTGGNALNTISKQENYLYNGTVGGVTITAGGSNYTNPSITFTGGGGSGAAATAVVINGAISQINMTNWGVNYSSGPTVNITDSTGSGATATSTNLSNVLDILSISVLWGDQRIAFSWLPFTAFQTFCREYTNQYDVPGVFTMHQGIQQVFMFQIPDQAYPMEWDIITLPQPLVNTTDIDIQVTPPWNDAVQFFAAHLCHLSLQNFTAAKFFYSGNPQSPGLYDARVRQLPATAYERRIYNPRYTFYNRIRRI